VYAIVCVQGLTFFSKIMFIKGLKKLLSLFGAWSFGQKTPLERKIWLLVNKSFSKHSHYYNIIRLQI